MVTLAEEREEGENDRNHTCFGGYGCRVTHRSTKVKLEIDVGHVK